MTMHGEIKVNDMVFGVWAASRRIGRPGTNTVPFIYDCMFEWVDEQGYWNDAVWDMEHENNTDGPLAPRVITEGYKRMKRRVYNV